MRCCCIDCVCFPRRMMCWSGESCNAELTRGFLPLSSQASRVPMQRHTSFVLIYFECEKMNKFSFMHLKGPGMNRRLKTAENREENNWAFGLPASALLWVSRYWFVQLNISGSAVCEIFILSVRNNPVPSIRVQKIQLYTFNLCEKRKRKSDLVGIWYASSSHNLQWRADPQLADLYRH